MFEATFLDREKLQYVGQVTRVNATPVTLALEAGQLPILTCMVCSALLCFVLLCLRFALRTHPWRLQTAQGETPEGQALNINADVAAQELAKVGSSLLTSFSAFAIHDSHQVMRPVKIVYISEGGGLRDDKGAIIPSARVL